MVPVISYVHAIACLQLFMCYYTECLRRLQSLCVHYSLHFFDKLLNIYELLINFIINFAKEHPYMIKFSACSVKLSLTDPER